MKKLILSILMVSLLSTVPGFADSSCTGHDRNLVHYYVENSSEYGISLNFDLARDGDNPADIFVEPLNHIEAYGCSNGWGYETRATLMAYDYDSEADHDLAYLYLYDSALLGNGAFSFEQYNINNPKCSCELGIQESYLGKEEAQNLPEPTDDSAPFIGSEVENGKFTNTATLADSKPHSNMKYFDCLSYSGDLTARTEVVIKCEQGPD